MLAAVEAGGRLEDQQVQELALLGVGLDGSEPGNRAQRDLLADQDSAGQSVGGIARAAERRAVDVGVLPVDQLVVRLARGEERTP